MIINKTLTSNSVVTVQVPDIMDEFMRKASTYPQFKIGVAINDYYFPSIADC